MDSAKVIRSAEELASRVEGCLREADALGLHDAGIHLDMALVSLRGTGLPPPDGGAAPSTPTRLPGPMPVGGHVPSAS